MSCNCKCNKGLCPVSFGIALGIACGLAVLLETLWTMHFGPSPWMEQMHMPAPTLSEGGMHALMVFVKGTIFGFFLALFYDGIICLKGCCRKSDGSSSCCGSKSDKPAEMK